MKKLMMSVFRKNYKNKSKNSDDISFDPQASEKEQNEILDKLPTRHIILDCSCVNYIDTQGVNAIVQLYENFKEIGVALYLSYCKRNFYK
jgi:anti-anti-sigma regulatory factor